MGYDIIDKFNIWVYLVIGGGAMMAQLFLRPPTLELAIFGLLCIIISNQFRLQGDKKW